MPCESATLWFLDAAGTRTSLGHVRPKQGHLYAEVDVPTDAALGAADFLASGPNPELCSAGGAFWVCTTCLQPPVEATETKAIR
jgi:hypothetical protein